MNLPNLLTLSRLAMAPVLAATVLANSLAGDVASLALLSAAGITDLLDGYLARKYGQATDFGKVVDPLADSFIFLALFYGFVATGWMPLWVYLVFVGRESFMHLVLRPYFLMRGVALGAKWTGKVKTSLQNAVSYGVLLAMAATRLWPEWGASRRSGLMAASDWALLAVAAVSLASLWPYLAELWRKGTTDEHR
jgi:CDP-diacylglycerol--glycerol-3-phosphate 3-phosphatidyltransferase